MIPAPAEAARNIKSAADVTSKSNIKNTTFGFLCESKGGLGFYLCVANITER